MAPLITDTDANDDFIRTISDDDSEFPVAEDNEEIPPRQNPNTTTPKSNKRKRDIIDRADVPPETSNKKTNIHQKKTGVVENTTSCGALTLEETWAASGEDDGAIDSDFEFQAGDGNFDVAEGLDGWAYNEDERSITGRKQGDKKGVDIDELIARRRTKGTPERVSQSNIEFIDGVEDGGQDAGSIKAETRLEEYLEALEEGEEDETLAEDAFGMGATGEVENSGEDMDSPSESGSGAVADEMPDLDDIDTSSAEETVDLSEQDKRAAFFAPEEPVPPPNTPNASTTSGFQSFSLSRPILRGLVSVGFTNATPIQKKAIPVALLGKDVVGGAVTGSGKTAAFIVPILERLLYRPKKVPTSRVAVLMPTRELAVQCSTVAKKLASYTDITFCQLIGGFSLREQEALLRRRPDVIIATPGRFIDHMRNSPSFTVETLEILVLDEADRMLEDGFADELNEILTTIPKSRQTMLFSATMTDSVDKLIRVGLNRPVRMLVNARKQTVGTLVQEFVRLRPGREAMRLGYLLSLCHEVFTDRVIIFFRQKKEAHRIRVIFGLLGIRAAELHGSMSQEQVSVS